MRQVSDVFLLTVAEVAATLVGLFLVAVFFYVDTGFRRFGGARNVVERYFRAGTRITLIVFAIPVGLSLALVAMDLVWARLLFALLSLLLLGANVDSAVRVRGVRRATGSTGLLINEVVTSLMTLVMILIPWILGGLRPTREHLAWAVVLSFAVGFLSMGVTVMSAFDVARLETAAPSAADGRRHESEQGR